MSRPIRACVDLAAIRENYRLAKRITAGSQALAVIKANGYGHGAVHVARALAAEADAFGVACTEEAQELRDSGIPAPIVLLEGVFDPVELELVDRLHLTTVVHDKHQLQWILAARPRRPFQVWLKIDTGMHRLGFPPDELLAAYARLADCDHVHSIVLMSHLARADEVASGCAAPAPCAIGSDPTERQLASFHQGCKSIAVPRSIANSATILTRPHAHFEWVRPGIMLYGLDPLDQHLPLAAGLRPAMRLESALTAVRELAAGEAIGYGGRFVCQHPTRVGVVAAGYADGYPRHARDGTPVAVAGMMTQLIGRVSMDMLTVDLTTLPQVQPGDPVELWGDQVSANAVAAAADTISYELLTGISRRVPLRYTGIAVD